MARTARTPNGLLVSHGSLMYFCLLLQLQLLTYEKTNICRQAHRDLVIAVERASDRGLLQLPVAFRTYDYSEYFKTLKQQTEI